MTGRDISAQIDLTRYYLTPLRVLVICGGLLVIAIGVSIVQFSQARDNLLPGGAPVGGDYVVFYGAAIAASEGEALKTYDHEAFEEHLLEVGPPREDYKLTWQYPPTYFLMVLPLAFLPFVPGYLAWTGGTAAVYFATMRKAGFSWLILFVILSAPSAFHAIITGQNGFLTASLIALAALYPDKRPLLAGLAAALLTVKPQLGVLLPIAYMFGGHWRAFWVAAIGTIVFGATATFVFEPEIWTGFLQSAGLVSERLGEGIMPIFKMITPFAWAKYLGLPFFLAAAFHGLFAIVTICAVARIWRTVPDQELRAAALCAGIFFVAPYGYYYEMIILALPVAILAKRALEQGWLQWEQGAIAMMYIGPMMMPGTETRIGFSFGFPCAVLIAAGVIRRIEHDYPGTFGHFFSRFSVARRPVAPTP